MVLLSSNISDTPDARQKVEAQVLRSLVDERLQLQEAKKQNIVATDDEINTALAQIEKQNNMQPGQLTQFLKSRGIDRGSLINQVTASIVWTKLVRRLGHDRWKQENNGWNDLTQNWAFKHGFLHACRHRPHTHSPEGEIQPVANRGLAAVSLILLLAFTLCSAFIFCHSKLFRRYPMSTLEVARQLRLSISKLPPNIRAPDAPAAPDPA